MLTRLIKLFSNKETVRLLSPAVDNIADNKIHNAVTQVHYHADWLEIEKKFTGMLLGCNSMVYGPMSEFEKSLLASMYKTYLKKPIPENLVPRLPAVIPKVMQALQSDKTDVGSLTNILSNDAVLVSEVLKLANSAYYSNSQTYKSLEQAIIKIGFNGIRQMVLNAAMKPILNNTSSHFVKIASGYLWDKTMNASLLSDCVAHKFQENRFYAYLSSLTLQTGMTVLLKDIDNAFNDRDVPRSKAFSEKLNRYALEVSARIIESWQFPEAVANALREQAIHDTPEKMSQLGSITFMSDKLAKVNLLMKNHHLTNMDIDLSTLVPADTAYAYNHCTKNISTL